MIPRHCREVALKKVPFPLTKRNIMAQASGKSAYTNTNYLILNNGQGWAVLKVDKTGEPGLFRKIQNVEIISLPEDTVYLENPEVDVQNASVMVRMAEEAGKDALIVKGKFEHISFVHKERTTPLVVFDVVPPSPPKIAELAEAALGTGRIKKPIRIVAKIVDLNEVAKRRATKYVMFPCYASTLISSSNDAEHTLYLDQSPVLKIPVSELTLIGCDLSMRTFGSLYGEKPEFVNICPKEMVRDTSVRCLSRCCIIDEGHVIEGNAAYLSWGASVGEVEEAIIDLFGLELGDIQRDGIFEEARSR